MNYKQSLLLAILFSFSCLTVQAKKIEVYKTSVLIVGGGASGVTAGLQASRLGAKTLIIEETDWLGGMLTSAGVSAVDGNHQLPSGLWGEFRQKLYDYYGGPAQLETGWVSNTLFEPEVGNQIFKQMTAKTTELSIWYQTKFSNVKKIDKGWVVQVTKGNKSYLIHADVVIDCTELGDVMAAAGAVFYVGMDSKNRTGEVYAPEEANNIIQDLTYVAVLKDYGKGTDKTISKPSGFDPKEFENSCDVSDPSSGHISANIDCEKMLTYGKLPNGKYMINWPKEGNDIYLNIIAKTSAEREIELKKAKLHTLRFIYYIQTVLGYKNLGLSDEFGTKDQLPKIPYHRESRRVEGLVSLPVHYLEKPFDQEFPLYRTGAIVGDYTIDHHHLKNPNAPQIDFIKIKIPSYNVPLGALIPKNLSNFIVAEKSISVSNIVAGATRLQPVVLEIGQAAGALAALSVKEGKDPKDLNIRDVQSKLLDAQVYLMPYLDVKPTDSYFKAVQKIGATGILKGTGNPYKWANQTWFYPNHPVSEFEMVKGLKSYYPALENYQASGADLTISEFIKMLIAIDPKISKDTVKQKYALLSNNEVMKRSEVAVLIDALLNPFDQAIDWFGNLK
ncbi:FAD-dependent oxidoreductase [Pedobacter glucosidilyticus]|uniref:FAD-dependent oxidoreductase n=1 Tax=Pedobacter glucosidilyticus TaxID=1122941 RepID=UPI0026F12383|nr:FAD-dependent oxidoreductase [Pedobacter glucosidilyticus]